MSKIRFFKCSSFIPSYLRLFHAAHPQLVELNYSSHYDALMGDCCGWADFWKHNLESTGYFDCADVVINAQTLQQTWAQENRVRWSEDSWVLDILAAQIRAFQPDILFTHDFSYVTPEFRRKIRKEVPSIRMIIGWDGVGRCDVKHFDGCDLILSCVQYVVDYYRCQGMHSEIFKLGFETSLLEKIRTMDRKIDCCFIGSIFLGAHEARFRTIAEISRQCPTTTLHLDVSKRRFFRSRIGLFARGDLGALWRVRSSWSDYCMLLRRGLPSLFGLDMYSKLAETRIGLNVHIDAAGENAGNMRLFEVTGMGACLLTDRKQNLAEIYEDGKEIIVFDSPSDAVYKMKWLISNPDICEKIAAAGQARTIREHSLGLSINQFVSKCINL
jgi:spore maturation protein CgeB